MSNIFLPLSKEQSVEVSIIHGGRTTVPTKYVVQTPIPGHDLLDIPCYSFLIENKSQNKRILYDLGLMKAWKEKQPPAILNQIEAANAVMDIKSDVTDQLVDAGIQLGSINAVIWSHHHVDHTGDPSLFPPSTSLIVGPGFKTNNTTFPGYPKNPDSLVADDAFHGREIIELDFSTAASIGGYPAIDYFGDGSFYILQSKGHTHDHISALARTSNSKFIFLGGDVAHHPGEYRPTELLSLPNDIEVPLPTNDNTPFLSVCPASVLETIHPGKKEGKDYRTTPFYQSNSLMNVSLPDAEASIEKMQAFDASTDVFTIIAHDTSLLDVLPFFPKTITDWDKAGYKSLGAWRFLKDFEKAIAEIKTEDTQ
ncbi:hypothetical protein BGW36DRAFT_460325 [Talaromyces proteolyticus]|uniref:Metallo-beta-lactamase domain-containing protein n=1 Tax=Talaromyces proteolyticus TaxID=1131652 RepID=A0AAD4KSH7_9EURO|nr:uncharacterized protein BGW36DRAFT_460325 [Talaromyces proteolyticus]KAH8698401.1 hypothetical protein BGW36DRAFT_460325 [Talaromyces proteolyticus]